MAISCDPSDLATDAACFCGIGGPDLLRVQTYLLAVLAGGSLDPNVLMAESAAFQAIPENMQLAIQNYLLCQIVNKP